MKIHYVSGSRADFGLMERCLRRLHQSEEHSLGIVVTGQHLLKEYGSTEANILSTGLPVVGRIPVILSGAGGQEMAVAMAEELAGLTRFWSTERPDLVLLLGDRGEMLAAALAALHLGILVAHIHGGERSGTIDESFRHAISKLSHIHFPATDESANRLIGMGEDPGRITVIGAPGLVGLTNTIRASGATLRMQYDLPAKAPVALVLFHPVVQENDDAAQQTETLLKTLDDLGVSQIILRPNSDAGGREIDQVLSRYKTSPTVRVLTHLEREDYLTVLASSDFIIGNSSSGVIESASFATPCVNVGSRQNDRERNTNTIDCPLIETSALCRAVERALTMTCDGLNVYGDGAADRRLIDALAGADLKTHLLVKRNTY